eukprot:CAMPEP_0185762462 /NCGR_PEP_ID=MMETSP1174-20130828/21431_1 /TAXON_ID=35687 /ORGANISM="Dictyocha speculum, Strain CCMP1381" /LENGTH=103 /DNA_ID=CAMNT_0028444149 /DNA_START=13 /DNA_END=324 /DNA_ORIENTATION=+
MTLCMNCTRADACAKDTDPKVFDVPVGRCFSPTIEFPDDSDSWGEFDILDECDRFSLTRNFYASSDASCTNVTDSYVLRYNTCLGPFSPPRPWGVFQCGETIA